MPTHTHTRTWARNGEVISSTFDITADTEKNSDVPLTASQSNKQENLALTAANIKSLLISCPTSITIKTNSTGSPAQTLTLTAGVPLNWSNEDGTTCPITADVTTLYITNNDATASTAKFRFLEDGTP